MVTSRLPSNQSAGTRPANHAAIGAPARAPTAAAHSCVAARGGRPRDRSCPRDLSSCWVLSYYLITRLHSTCAMPRVLRGGQLRSLNPTARARTRAVGRSGGRRSGPAFEVSWTRSAPEVPGLGAGGLDQGRSDPLPRWSGCTCTDSTFGAQTTAVLEVAEEEELTDGRRPLPSATSTVPRSASISTSTPDRACRAPVSSSEGCAGEGAEAEYLDDAAEVGLGGTPDVEGHREAPRHCGGGTRRRSGGAPSAGES